MKERKGFVSNSSSSSFVIISRKASLSEIDDPKVKISLGWGSDGEYYAHPTNEQIEWMKVHDYIDYDLQYEFFAVEDGTILTGESGDNDFASMAKQFLAPDKSTAAYAKEVDYHYPQYLEDFIEKVAPNEY